MTRAVLRSLDARTGMLRAEVRDYLPGQALQRDRRHRRQPHPPYSDGEWTRLWECCVAITKTASAEQRASVLTGRSGQDPATGGAGR
jgi:hypothetical protein